MPEVFVIVPPDGSPDGWDAADAVEQGWSVEGARALLDLAKSAVGSSHSQASSRKSPKKSLLIDIANRFEKWRDDTDEAYVSFHDGQRLVHCRVRDKFLRSFLTFTLEQTTGAIPHSQAIEDVLRSIEGHCSQGPIHRVFRRVAKAGDALFLDLCDSEGRAIEITARGWNMVQNPPVKFVRSGHNRPLPEPIGGALIEKFRGYVPGNDDSFKLVVSWLLASFLIQVPLPILIINGEAGSGKSFTSRLIRSVIDPSSAPIRSIPRDESVLLLAAQASHQLVFDNLSTLPAEVADSLARLSTGSGIGQRKLYTNFEESIMTGHRLLLLNGISDLSDRADIGSRSMVIHLPRIHEEERQLERDVLHAFERDLPEILGAILDVVSTGLARVKTIKLGRLPRLADFGEWIEACSPALGWKSGEFLDLYDANKGEINETALEADVIALAVVSMVRNSATGFFEGSPRQLLEKLIETTPEGVRKSKYWPTSPSSMGQRLRRSAPLIRSAGFEVESRHSGTRTIRIVNLAVVRP